MENKLTKYSLFDRNKLPCQGGRPHPNLRATQLTIKPSYGWTLYVVIIQTPHHIRESYPYFSSFLPFIHPHLGYSSLFVLSNIMYLCHSTRLSFAQGSLGHTFLGWLSWLNQSLAGPLSIYVTHERLIDFSLLYWPSTIPLLWRICSCSTLVFTMVDLHLVIHPSQSSLLGTSLVSHLRVCLTY